MGRDLGGFIDLDPEEAMVVLEDRGREVILLDVRTPYENARRRIPGSTLIPLQEFLEQLMTIDKTKEVLVYCEHGHRSLRAASLLAQQGCHKVYNLRGGIVKWRGPIEGKDA